MAYAIISQVWWALNILLNVLVYALIAYAILSWIVRPYSPLYRWMNRLLSPVLNPLRPLADRLMRAGVVVDLTPLLAILAVQLARWVLSGVFGLLLRAIYAA
ncbi:MAG: YggT family protein [Clostridiales bacterium]|nr:YggT family protein [Clostridiales bacterium]